MSQPRTPTIDEQIEYVEEYVPNMYWSDAIVETLEKYKRVKVSLSLVEEEREVFEQFLEAIKDAG